MSGPFGLKILEVAVGLNVVYILCAWIVRRTVLQHPQNRPLHIHVLIY